MEPQETERNTTEVGEDEDIDFGNYDPYDD